MPSAFDDIPSAFDAYIDAEGVPQFRHSCVLFWNVLGVKALSRDPDAHSHLVALSAALKRARARAGFESDAGQLHHAVTWFTDNVVIGSPIRNFHEIETALGFTAIGAAYLQLLLLDAGFVGRGGIAFGEHYMQEDFVFGPALIDAAELADKKKSPPRVALTPEAADLNRAVVTEFYASPEDSPHADEYLVDQEGDVVFVDHLSLWLGEEDDEDMAVYLLSRQRDIIEAALARHQAGDVFDKWKWLADMHNHVLSHIPAFQGFQIDAGDTLHSFRSFISTL